LTRAAAGLAQMGIGVAVLTQTKFIDDWYPKMVAGYMIMSSKAASSAQGDVALAWRENNPSFEVKSVRFYSPNMLTYQLIKGDEQIYAVGTYIPPNCSRGVEDICPAVEACPAGCKLLIMRDLNANVGFPHNKQEEVIVDLLNELCLVDSSPGFGFGLLAGPPQGQGGRGANKGGQCGTTCSQITFWHKQGRCANLRVWGSASRGSSTPIIAQSLR
jgi:hypothetical protein